jgi:hypothetical protein
VAILQTVDLNGGADIPGGDTLFAGFTKVNDNVTALGDNAAAATSGAKQIGYYDGTATTVQDALDAISATSSVTNVGAGQGEVYRDISAGSINLRTLVPGTNITFDTTTDTDVIEINSGLANSSEVTVVDTFPYDVASYDEIILADLADTPGTINLPTGLDKRILTIKNLAWTGAAASPTLNTAELSIAADTGEYVEDDRTALPTTTTAIGPGSAMRIVFDANSSVWSII